MGGLRWGVVGYGGGGRRFHAPYLQQADGIDLVGVVTANPERRAQVARDLPGIAAYDDLDALLAAGVDAVTITTPPQTRRELVLAALAAGLHVVADKPFAPTAQAARELVRAAEQAGRALNVYHNRRWDHDAMALRAALDAGRIGTVWSVESRFDLDEPSTLDAGPDGGLLRDLGTHLVDQMRWLLGPVQRVYAELTWVDLPAGRTDAAFDVSLTHAGGARSRVSATKLNRRNAREWRAYGSGGSYVVDGVGELGAYQDFYTQFAAAVRGAGPFPVPAEEGVRTLEVLDAARLSAQEQRVVTLAGS